jgi:hypothetical protein
MDDTQIPKQTFYSQTANGTHTTGGQYKWYKAHSGKREDDL